MSKIQNSKSDELNQALSQQAFILTPVTTTVRNTLDDFYDIPSASYVLVANSTTGNLELSKDGGTTWLTVSAS